MSEKIRTRVRVKTRLQGQGEASIITPHLNPNPACQGALGVFLSALGYVLLVPWKLCAALLPPPTMGVYIEIDRYTYIHIDI